jgi:hypothetical protein
VTQDVSRPGPNQCHDITVYPEVGLAGGACAGYGILLDISNPEAPAPRRGGGPELLVLALGHLLERRVDGPLHRRVGGRRRPRCRETDRYEWGANAIFTIEGGRMVHQSYYKMPAPQTELENCVAHNGSLIPIPGREIKVQAWYQGGVSIFDWTDPANPFEIAFFDRGPYNADRLQSAGPWSTYWYNGYIYSSEISRGLDVLELLPAASSRERDRRGEDGDLARVQPAGADPDGLAPQLPVVRSYVDQLERSGGLSATRIAALRAEFERIEGLAPAGRVAPLGTLAQALNGEAQGSSDAAKVRLLAGAVRDLAGAQR